MSAKPEQHLKVGDWWYLPQQDKLVKIDETGDISETASLDNLCQKALNYFLVNAGRLITRDELLSDVWGVRDVSDGRISRVIRVLRVALGDDSREPKYIETIPKRGFRFIAPVSEVILVADNADTDAITTQSELAGKHQNHNQHRHWWLLAAVFVSCMLAVTGWHYWQQSQLEQHVPFGRFEPLSSMDGLELYTDISKDGRFLVFSHSVDIVNRWSLIVQDLQTLQKKVVKSSDNSALAAVWSPDRTFLIYQKLLRGKYCEIRKLRLSATEFTELSDELVTYCSPKNMLARMSISPDGQYLVFPDWQERSGNIALMLFPFAGGKAEQLSNPPQSSMGDFAVRYSNDGKHLAFLRDAAGSAGQIWLMSLTDRSSKQLVQLDGSYPGNVAWAGNDEKLIFPSNASELSAVNVKTGEISLWAHVDGNPQEVIFSSDQQLIASVGRFWQSSILKLNNPLINPTPSSEKLDFATRTDGLIGINPVASGPNAILSNRSGSLQVWFYYPDGRQQQISKFDGHFWPRAMEFSPDGKKLIALVAGRIWLLQPDQEPIQVPTSSQHSRSPSWGWDSASIIFQTSVNGRWQMMRYSLNSGIVEALDQALDFYQESSDGRYVVRSFNDNNNFEMLDLSGNKITPLTAIPKQEFMPTQLVLHSNAIYFESNNGSGKCEIFSYLLENKRAVSTGIENRVCRRRFSISLDGNFIYQDDGNIGDIDIARLKWQTVNK